MKCELTKTGGLLSPSAVEYTIRCILKIAGVPEQSCRLQETTVALGDTIIFFQLLPEEEQKRLFRGEAQPTQVDSFDGKIKIPLFGGERFARWNGTELSLCADILTISFALLSRYEETLTDSRDQYGRFSYQESLSCRYGLIDFPLVDEYAMLLRRELVEHGVTGLLPKRRPRVLPTHDVDELWRFASPFKVLKSIIGGDLLIRRSFKTAVSSLKEAMHSRCTPEKDPRYLDCIRLKELSQENDMFSTFFFLDYEGGEDQLYDIRHPSVGKLMQILKKEGCVIGIHGGLGTCDAPSAFRIQKECVDEIFNEKVKVGRQHFLCFDAMSTPKIWDDNGILEDQTLTFHDREGFRCGTCHPYPLYDLAADQPLSVKERPLLLMDGTVEGYRRLTVETALDSARMLRERVFAVGGDFVILWHNSSLDRGWEEWYQRFYVQWLRESGEILKQNDLEAFK